LSQARLAILFALSLAGCSRRAADPPPPVSSAEIATAPPHALGARAASLDPPEPPTPLHSMPQPEQPFEQEFEPDAAPGASPDADAGGTPL